MEKSLEITIVICIYIYNVYMVKFDGYKNVYLLIVHVYY